MNFENIIEKFEVKYYDNLIDYCKLNNLNYKSIQQKRDNFNINYESETSAKSSEKDTTVEVNYNEDYLYKKEWNKLQTVHKIVKLKEFISKLLINNNDDKEKLTSEIVKLVHDKTLTKKDKVKYDSNLGRVIAISILTHKNGKYIIKKSK